MGTPVQMIHHTGATATGTMVILADGSAARADVSGRITVDSQHVSTLMAGGWQIVVPGGATHVP